MSWNLSAIEHAIVHMAYRKQTGGREFGALAKLVTYTTATERESHRFIAAKYRYLCTMGIDGCTFSKYI